MAGNYSFFQNRDCEYFPCHDTDHPEDFNCLFCYCPFYLLGDRCGGKFRYTEKGIKNCTYCDYPHRRENYNEIVQRFQEIVRAMPVPDHLMEKLSKNQIDTQYKNGINKAGQDIE